MSKLRKITAAKFLFFQLPTVEYNKMQEYFWCCDAKYSKIMFGVFSKNINRKFNGENLGVSSNFWKNKMFTSSYSYLNILL
jgi:hypothetical protein